LSPPQTWHASWIAQGIEKRAGGLN
jgi:hypothetical protein